MFARHSAIVLPYTHDFTAQSGIVFVALAYELPVVASEAGGLRDLFDQFAIGTSFRQSTPQALALAVRSLYDEPNGRRCSRRFARPNAGSPGRRRGDPLRLYEPQCRISEFSYGA